MWGANLFLDILGSDKKLKWFPFICLEVFLKFKFTFKITFNNHINLHASIVGLTLLQPSLFAHIPIGTLWKVLLLYFCPPSLSVYVCWVYLCQSVTITRYCYELFTILHSVMQPFEVCACLLIWFNCFGLRSQTSLVSAATGPHDSSRSKLCIQV